MKSNNIKDLQPLFKEFVKEEKEMRYQRKAEICLPKKGGKKNKNVYYGRRY